jgi:hypothetical protein
MLARALACTTSATGVAMAIAGASGRGATPAQQIILGSMAVLMTVGAQTLPAVARGRRMMLPVWAGCIAMSVYAQAAFFAQSHQDTSAARADQVQATAQASALDEQLAHINARPVPDVLARISSTQTRLERITAQLAGCERRCTDLHTAQTKTAGDLDALRAELADAQHAADLRRQRQDIAAEHDARRTAAGADPIDSAIGATLGVSPARAGQIMAVAQGLLIELIGALLWTIALPEQAQATQPTRQRPRPQPFRARVPKLHALVQRVRGLVAKAREQPRRA